MLTSVRVTRPGTHWPDPVRTFLVAIGLALLAGCGQQETEQDGSADRLRALADDIWADQLDNSTYLRLQEGLVIEKFEDLTLERHRQTLANQARWRQRLSEITPAALSDDDLITYEMLDFQLKDVGANDDDFWLAFDVTAYQAPYLFQFAHQALAAYRFTDRTSVDGYLTLVGEYADMIDHLVLKLDGQMARSILLPQAALPSVRAIWRGIQAAAPGTIRVAGQRLAALTEEDRAGFSAALDALMDDRVAGGFERLLDKLGQRYEAAAPVAVGIGQYPAGPQVYARLVRSHTTLDLSPQEIHERGKRAVADIAARMLAIRDQLGFEGTAREFHDHLKTDGRFIAATPADVEARYMAYIGRIEPHLDAYFEHRPKAAYGVRRLPLAAEPSMTFGYYNPPTAEDPVGYYNYNGSDLENRSLIGAGSLIYHELLPGHHFHLATQKENRSLHPLRQNYSVSAFTEGWAEYAASLGLEMGVYETPHDLYGRYIMEIFLASRLVVDTGMNALGWSLEDARAYMSAHLFHSDVEIASETLRYSTSIPAQALAYRIGYETFWGLRRRAEVLLGADFDIRAYHTVVLADGAQPLAVLTAKVDRYVAANRPQ